MFSVKYYIKTQSKLNNPCYRDIVDTTQALLFKNKKLTPQFAIRVQEIIKEMQMQLPFIKVDFSYKILNINKPTWSMSAPVVNLEIVEHPKNITPAEVYRAEWRRIKRETYSGHIEIFTDVSKTETGVGAPAIVQENNPRYVIYSDSYSVVKSLAVVNYTNSIIRKVQHDIASTK